MLASIVLPLILSPAASETVEDPSADTLSDKTQWFVIPAFAYTPETSALLGAATILSFKNTNLDEPLQSSARAAAFYTLRNQWGVDFTSELYLDRDRVLLRADGLLYDGVDFFFGVGDSPRREGEEFFVFDRNLEVAALYRIPSSQLFAGLLFRTQRLDVRDAGSAEQLGLLGGSGGQTFGLGAELVWDGRDRALWTQDGFFGRASWAFHRDVFVSDFSFSELSLDVRGFKALWPEWILGGQAVVQVRSGDVPFFRQATVGGGNRLRGSFAGRFRDDVATYAQTEIRTPYLLWRFAATAFGGLGVVAPSLDDVFSARLIGIYGAGLRVALTEDGANLRIDYGRGPDGESNFYLLLGEAF